MKVYWYSNDKNSMMGKLEFFSTRLKCKETNNEVNWVNLST